MSATTNLLMVAKEIALRKRPDPCRHESNAGRWVTLTLPAELVKRLDAAIAEAEKSLPN